MTHDELLRKKISIMNAWHPYRQNFWKSYHWFKNLKEDIKYKYCTGRKLCYKSGQFDHYCRHHPNSIWNRS